MHTQEQEVNARPLLMAFPEFSSQATSTRVSELLSLRLYHCFSRQLNGKQQQKFDDLLHVGTPEDLNLFLHATIPDTDQLAQQESRKILS